MTVLVFWDILGEIFCPLFYIIFHFSIDFWTNSRIWVTIMEISAQIRIFNFRQLSFCSFQKVLRLFILVSFENLPLQFHIPHLFSRTRSSIPFSIIFSLKQSFQNHCAPIRFLQLKKVFFSTPSPSELIVGCFLLLDAISHDLICAK